ncbi:hypothetical protein GCK72_003335 [Caenorhabditis remanei]|uniref:C2H2-type domain-containing protein n=1 Tax=Caenorhabditis remanei TaxID=31234 RepID=A0A6A5HU79_CAERE|nr:hypothetical protein GCK72_003335 [Caenorhabditis remanei]KAF1771508.1 hypothetical protein GCK72_003335 [Caenorhabditis remanei]
MNDCLRLHLFDHPPIGLHRTGLAIIMSWCLCQTQCLSISEIDNIRCRCLLCLRLIRRIHQLRHHIHVSFHTRRRWTLPLRMGVETIVEQVERVVVFSIPDEVSDRGDEQQETNEYEDDDENRKAEKSIENRSRSIKIG